MSETDDTTMSDDVPDTWIDDAQDVTHFEVELAANGRALERCRCRWSDVAQGHSRRDLAGRPQNWSDGELNEGWACVDQNANSNGCDALLRAQQVYAGTGAFPE